VRLWSSPPPVTVQRHHRISTTSPPPLSFGLQKTLVLLPLAPPPPISLSFSSPLCEHERVSTVASSPWRRRSRPPRLDLRPPNEPPWLPHPSGAPNLAGGPPNRRQQPGFFLSTGPFFFNPGRPRRPPATPSYPSPPW
jgi:hypothetical protein